MQYQIFSLSISILSMFTLNFNRPRRNESARSLLENAISILQMHFLQCLCLLYYSNDFIPPISNTSFYTYFVIFPYYNAIFALHDLDLLLIVLIFPLSVSSVVSLFQCIASHPILHKFIKTRRNKFM